jgi:uncharacterized protein (TIGR03067 family)
VPRRILSSLAAVAFSLAFAPAPFPRLEDDPKNLEGAWLVRRYDQGATPVGLANKVKVRIDKGKLTFLHPGVGGAVPSVVYSWTLDRRKAPRWIDLTQEATGAARMRGIYRFERGRLQIAFHAFGVNERPTEFGGADSRAFYLTLKREKP